MLREGSLLCPFSLQSQGMTGSLHLKPSLCQYLAPAVCVSSWAPCLAFPVPHAAKGLQGQWQMGKAGAGLVGINFKLGSRRE